MAPLVQELRRESNVSFETIYRRHVRDVYGFALSMLGNSEDAEDVAQTTFLNAFRALERGEEVRNLRAWLITIAHNVCRQRFRTASRRPHEVELDVETAEAFRDEDAPTAQEIRHAMDQLSFNQRTVLVLREIEGLAYEEIAQAMDISLSAVETLLFRARQALREQLEAAEHDLGCDAVQRLISLQLDGKLARRDRGLLRAHLRSCSECARFARSQRARKRVMPGLAGVPLPASLAGAFQFGGPFVGSKAAALAVSAALVGAGALVETGVIPTPGQKAEAPIVSSAVEGVGLTPSTGARAGTPFAFSFIDPTRATRVNATVATSPSKRTSKAGAARKAPNGSPVAATAGAGPGTGSGSTGSGGGSLGGGSLGGGGALSGLTPPPASVVQPPGSVPPNVAGGVNETVGGVNATVGGVNETVAGATKTVTGATKTVKGATETVTGIVGQAGGKVSSLPGSVGVQPPSLPSVPAIGTGSPP